MNNPNLDVLYVKLDKHIKLSQSYTEIKELSFIIKSCRLKPYLYIKGQERQKLTLQRWWFDEFGNSLKIIKNKRIKITYNDLSLDRSKIACTDLYYGLSLDKISKMSKLLYLCCAQDENIGHIYYFLAFLGIDNYLRCYLLFDGKCQAVSPLLLGIKNLKLIANNCDIKYFKKIENKENMPIPCLFSEAWLSFLPAGANFLALLKNQYENIYSIINKGNI